VLDPLRRAGTTIQEVRARPLVRLFAAVAGLVAAALCLVLTPVQSRVWNGADSPALVRAVDPFVDLLLALRSRVAPGVDDYHFFGRFFFLVYLLALAGLWALHHQLRGEGDRRKRTAFRVLTAGLVVGAVADLGPYWGGLESPFAALFLLEELALLAILVGTVLYGRALLLGGSAARWLGWLFVLAGPGALPATWVTGYFPHGTVLLFTFAVAAADVLLLTPGSPTVPPEDGGSQAVR
jgi:hypothetical protein